MTPEQLTLDARTEVDVRRLPLDERWRLFIADNPHLVGEITRATRALLAARRTDTIGLGAVWEELRYRVHTSGDPYRLDNSLRAPAARWLMENVPGLDGAYTTRRSKADR